jgi:hypothetical protein
MQDSTLDLGTRLREARLRRGWTLRNVAASTRIPVDWLAAIERNEFDRLPQGIFRRSYVRTFATHVGVEAEPLPDALLSNPDVTFNATREVDVRAWRHHLSTALTVLLLSTILVLTRTEWNGDPVVSPAAPSSPTVGEVTTAGPSETSVPAHPIDSALPHSRASLTMQFLGPCWISATADGRRVVHRLVAEGERLEIEGQDSISIDIGDAGAVWGSINGGSPRVLGANREVLRMELAPGEPGRAGEAI